MSEAYIGEIRVFGFDRVPKNWAQCNGQILPIAQNQALFSILGTTYGGNGQTTFALPDLRGTAPIHVGAGGGGTYSLGQRAGEEAHTLLASEMPAHAHPLIGSGSAADAPSPAGNLLAASSGLNPYAAPGALAPLAPGAIDPAGGGQPHANMQPYLVLNVCICLFGIFPSRS